MLKVAYTAHGRRLHLVDATEGRRSGRTLCGKYGYVHPDFDNPATAHVLAVRINMGCQTCITRSDQREE